MSSVSYEEQTKFHQRVISLRFGPLQARGVRFDKSGHHMNLLPLHGLLSCGILITLLGNFLTTLIADIYFPFMGLYIGELQFKLFFRF